MKAHSCETKAEKCKHEDTPDRKFNKNNLEYINASGLSI
ncbi:Uncharacterized protein dnm_028990 [Desulfonema magnum]|uniref:Uncharacterized protein n=1 Tax=Desulfonema magnum TaxID=45655 RepID=A0A975BKR8_9BACT|nr:Uncharacterized protein dnm_028990 [Desulfonema magnum]